MTVCDPCDARVTSHFAKCHFMLVFLRKCDANVSRRHETSQYSTHTIYVHTPGTITIFMQTPAPAMAAGVPSVLPNNSFIMNTNDRPNDETFPAPPRGFGIGTLPPIWTNGRPPTSPRPGPCPLHFQADAAAVFWGCWARAS